VNDLIVYILPLRRSPSDKERWGFHKGRKAWISRPGFTGLQPNWKNFKATRFCGLRENLCALCG